MNGIKIMLAGIASILTAIFFMAAGGTYSPVGMIAIFFLIVGIVLVVYGLFAKERNAKGKGDDVAAENNPECSEANKEENKN